MLNLERIETTLSGKNKLNNAGKDITSSIVKKTSGAAILFYLLIGFEFLYMASPFAAYFYSVYRPGIEFIDKYPSIAWLTGFFLPHLVEETKSPILNLLRPSGAVIAVTGLLIFIVCAFQVYYSKIFKKGIVTGGLYKYIRHPQYTAFIVCSFGLLILWPRYLALVMFIALLFFYYSLAKVEEKECERKFAGTYINYKDSTGMFLPFKIFPSRLSSSKKLSLPVKIILTALFYFSLTALSVQAADLLKRASIDMLYSYNSGNTLYISIFESNEEKIKRIVEVADNNYKISSIKQAEVNTFYINYILPSDMYLSEVPMLKPGNASIHVFQRNYSPDKIKVIFNKAVYNKGYKIQKDNVLFNSLSLEPVAEVWMDPVNNRIVKIIELSGKEVRYKNIPEPLF